MGKESLDREERQIRFVARHYQEGRLNGGKAWKQFAAVHKIARVIPFRRYMLAIASVMLILLSVGTWYVMESRKPEWVAISTAPGQMKNVYLPDSTLVSLAGNSSLRYDARGYRKTGRRVEMKGKAFFEVVRNKARPFSVRTTLAVVEVLGTSFQVEDENAEVCVNVATGKVRFTAGENKQNVILTAGMSATYSMEKKDITVVTKEEENYLSWKTGLLRFNNTPLEEVVQDLNEYYQVKLVNKTETSDRCLTASFNKMPLDEVLQVINQTLDVVLVPEK